METENAISVIIKVLAVIIACVGIFIGLKVEGHTAVIIIASDISAIFIYAIGEIISLLQEIVDNTKATAQEVNNLRVDELKK